MCLKFSDDNFTTSLEDSFDDNDLNIWPGMYQYTAECTAWICVISQFDSEVVSLNSFEFSPKTHIVSSGTSTFQHQNEQCNVQCEREYGHGGPHYHPHHHHHNHHNHNQQHHHYHHNHHHLINFF